MEEIWKIIPGTYEKYSVSNLGRVRRNEHYTDVRPDNYHFNWRKHHYKEKILNKLMSRLFLTDMQCPLKVLNTCISPKRNYLKDLCST